MPEVIDFIAGLVRRKLRFLAFILVIGSIGIVYAHGGSWTSIVFVAVAMVILFAFWIITSFWLAVFRNFGRKEQQ